MEENEVTLRAEEPRDASSIEAVTTRAFAASDLGHDGEADLVARLRTACPEAVSLVAEVGGDVVGHILFTPAVLASEGGEITGMGLAPMSVSPECQGRGIGSLLVRRGLETLRAGGCPFAVVLGHPEFYPRFGFAPARRFGITCAFAEADSDAFMVLFLAGRPVAGVLSYHREFG